jgi:hypothetical protein
MDEEGSSQGLLRYDPGMCLEEGRKGTKDLSTGGEI